MHGTHQGRRVRILHAIKGLGPGGAEALLVGQLNLGDSAAFEYHVAFARCEWDQRLGDVAEHATTVTCLDAKLEFRLGWLTRWLRLVKRVDPDIIHVHSPYLAVFIRVLNRITRRRVLVYTEHNRWVHHETTTRRLNRLTFPLNDHTVAVSRSVAEGIVSPRRNLSVIIHGIDLRSASSLGAGAPVRQELAPDDGTILITTVANLRYSKDYPTLLRAARTVTEAHPNVRFVAAGVGPLEGAIRQQARELGLSAPAFQLLGYRDDVPELLAASDVFVLASDGEALGLVLLEAMAAGCPVIATAAGGATEVVPSTAGSLVPPKDPHALAAAIVSLIRDPQRRRSMATSGKETASTWSLQDAVSEIESLYLELLDAAPAGNAQSR